MNIVVFRSHIDGFTVQAPYHEKFVADLKTAVPADRRMFLGKNCDNAWLVAGSFEAEVMELARTYYDEVIDVRVVGEPGLVEAERRIKAQGALQAQIKHSQWLDSVRKAQITISENREWIVSRCAKLQTQIDTYSTRSRSAVKGDMVRRKYMLEQTLANAETAVEDLKPVEKNSALALVRYLKENNVIAD